ncbi:MAG: hypothetical protein ACK5YP_06540 [Betaproteobacteria bacterium]
MSAPATRPLAPARPLVTAAAVLLLAACAAPASINLWREAKAYTLPQSALGAVPCVSDGATRAFGATPQRSSHNNSGQNAQNRRNGLGAPEELEVRPADAASADERVLFGFWTNRPDATLVRLAVVAGAARRAALETTATAVLEQCGAWPP